MDLLATSGIFLLISLIGFFITFCILYFLIKWAVKSAIIEAELVKGKYMLKEKEKIVSLLANGIITKEEYNRRLDNFPVSIIYS